MNSAFIGAIDTGRNGDSPSPDSLQLLAQEVDRQLVLDFGVELLDGSGFENEMPEPDFAAEDSSDA